VKFIFTCGGTAGHINPALAIASALREMMPDAEFLFIGTGRELEKRLIPMAGFNLECITVSGLERGFTPGMIAANIRAVGQLVRAFSQSGKILRTFQPDVVIGTGGYVCYPVLTKASKMKIPTVIHESNAIPGLTAKLVSGRVDRVLVAFQGTEHQYKKPDRVVFTGTPVRGSLASMTKSEARAKLGIGDRPLVVSFWGSLGASKMNEIMADFIQLNTESCAFNHIHATGGGERGVQEMQKRLSERGITETPLLDLRPYIDNMDQVMTAADIVLCRAGASTIAELTVKGKPAVIVPSPNVTNDHQKKNALCLKKAGAAEMIEEKDCTGAGLFNAVLKLLNDRDALQNMSTCSQNLGVSDATNRIINIIISLIH
jgi:UDP-N-acetylglucosamine--N-acetylmuramyl-(pentapeptide) pyrophosphoryl-undecaprenol N-acetylglucosamine transferase